MNDEEKKKRKGDDVMLAMVLGALAVFAIDGGLYGLAIVLCGWAVYLCWREPR